MRCIGSDLACDRSRRAATAVGIFRRRHRRPGFSLSSFSLHFDLISRADCIAAEEGRPAASRGRVPTEDQSEAAAAIVARKTFFSSLSRRSSESRFEPEGPFLSLFFLLTLRTAAGAGAGFFPLGGA